jgi:hypothetical protein
MLNLGLIVLVVAAVVVAAALLIGLKRVGANPAGDGPPSEPRPLPPPHAASLPKPDPSQRPTVSVSPVEMEELMRQKAAKEPGGAPRAAGSPSGPEAATVPSPEPGEQNFFKKLTATAPPPKGLLRLATPQNQRTAAVPVFASTPKGSPLLSPEDEAASRSTDELEAVGGRTSAESTLPTASTVVGRKPRA